MSKIVCDGRGDNGDHCCYVGGEVCGFLVYEGDQPRCGIWDKDLLNYKPWLASPMGKSFLTTYPGYSCHDWPQKIPAVMEEGIGLCCWQGVADGNVG